jgi:hypothetical protein
MVVGVVAESRLVLSARVLLRKVCPPSWRLVYKRLRQHTLRPGPLRAVIIPDEMMVVLIPSQVTQTST